ncbi:chromate efflux transporter [Alteromonas sp. ASW11-36]|uniref:Chromate efflux transporter n=1 Tax=Alteromonas arenosi TaxID=3055817 RepID=A0ABT7T0B1_9ALTE|nr:chromate efflux transporter [Alteromonas sp. ASW11-36]MDM7861879.1 chromate efflux transporter [Alteromonas sp. ASW11-36]
MLHVFFVFLRLGCISFGGPVAHLGYFQDEFVKRRQWLTADEYAELVALCQFIPGPASSQVGAAIGFRRRSYPGALAAWLGFTLPSALILGLAASALVIWQTQWLVVIVDGLKLVAVAIVAQAVWNMQKSLCGDNKTRLIALWSVLLLLFFPLTFMQVTVIGIAGLVGWIWCKQEPPPPPTHQSRLAKQSLILLCCFALLLCIPIVIPIQHQLFALIDSLYRAGALVFGGGHVVLPLLHAEFVQTEMLSNDQFLIGYGLAQAVPGPLFTVATYIGATAMPNNALVAAILATIVIFLPGMLLLFALLPIWQSLRNHHGIQRALIGINAAVVGILAAVLIDPLAAASLKSWQDAVIVFIALVGLLRFKLHPLWAIVVCLSLNTIGSAIV